MARRLYPFFAVFLALCFCLSPVQAKPDLPPDGADTVQANLSGQQAMDGEEPLVPSLALPGTSYSYAPNAGH